MQMTLNLVRDVDWSHFLTNYISEKLFNYVLLNLNEDKVFILDDYINNILEIQLSTKEILKFAFENLVIADTGSEFVVMIDPNINIPNSKHKLITVIKLIDYGNLEVRGCGIISQAFSYIVMQLPNLVTLYRLQR
jgi:hypothetical protein